MEPTAMTRTVNQASSLLATMWALANIVHLVNLTAGNLSVAEWVNITAAFWLLARPASGHRLALLAAVQLADTWLRLPFAPDHQVLAAFVNVVIVACYLRRRDSSTAVLLGRVADYARPILLVAYFAAASAKYNVDFLSPAHSCASYLAQFATFGAIDRDGPLAAAAVGLTLVGETCVFWGLVIRRTRKWAVLLGCTFHFLLSASPAIGVGDFTLTLWSLFLMFLPAEDLAAVAHRLSALAARSGVVRDLQRLPRVTLMLALPLIGVVGRVDDGSIVLLANWVVTTLLGVGLIVSQVSTLRHSTAAAPRLGPLRAGQLVAISCVLAIASTPYLGLGSLGRFGMFSNLRTEGPGTNHLFWPSFHLVDSQNRWYVVEEAHGFRQTRAATGNTPAAEAKAAVPEIEVRRALSDIRVGATLRGQNGETIVVESGKPHPLRGHLPWLEAKTQSYRPFIVNGVTDPGFCSN